MPAARDLSPRVGSGGVRGALRGVARGAAGLAALAVALAPGPAASRDAVGWVEARQLVELFGGSCLRFATPAALRVWLEGQGIRRMAEAQAQALLRGPGRAYDVSTRAGHLALLSRDDGGCVAMAESVDAARLSSLLEQRMRMAGLAFQLLGEPGGGADAPGRRYSVQHGRHQSLLVVEVVRLDDRLQAALLLAPVE